MCAENRESKGHLKALVGGKLIDGTGRAPLENAAVVISGDRISSVGRADAVTVPTGTEVVDVAGKTVMPGLINCHAHLCLGGDPDPITALQQRSFTENVLIAAQHAEATLRAGVTTLRDLGGWEGVDFGLKKAIRALC